MTRSAIRGTFAGFAATKTGRPIRLDFDVRVRPTDPNPDKPAPRTAKTFPGAALILVKRGATAETVKLALLKTCIELEKAGLRAAGETDGAIVRGDKSAPRRKGRSVRRSIKRPISRRSIQKQ